MDDSEIVITKKLTNGGGSSVRIRIGGSARSPTEQVSWNRYQYDYIDDSYMKMTSCFCLGVRFYNIIMLVINDGEKMTIKATINCFCSSGGLGGGRGQRKPLRAAGVCLQRWEPSFFDHLS